MKCVYYLSYYISLDLEEPFKQATYSTFLLETSVKSCAGPNSRAVQGVGFGRPLAGIAGSNPAEAWMSLSCESCVLSGRGL
jgi:hypothetical protein